MGKVFRDPNSEGTIEMRVKSVKRMLTCILYGALGEVRRRDKLLRRRMVPCEKGHREIRWVSAEVPKERK